MRAWLARIVFAAGSCVVLDAVHAGSGTTWYPHPTAFGVPWWTPILFSTAALAQLLGIRTIRRGLGAPPLPSTGAGIASDALAFVTVYAATSFLGAAPIALAVTLTCWWAARMLAGTPRWVVAVSLLTAVAGPGVEVALIAAGVFGYHHPDVLGIPWWLPAIYLHGAVLGARLEGGLS